jgi:hypothetical protein
MAYPYSSTGTLYDTVGSLQQMGFYDVILPFLLVFAISFAVLQKVRLFGEASKKVNIVIALVLGFLFLQNQYLIFVLQRFLPNMSIVMIIALMFLLLVGIFGGSYSGFGGIALNIAFILSIIITLIALSVDFMPGFNLLDWFYQFVPNPGAQSLILTAIVVIAVIALLVREPGRGDSLGKRLGEDVNQAFGK